MPNNKPLEATLDTGYSCVYMYLTDNIHDPGRTEVVELSVLVCPGSISTEEPHHGCTTVTHLRENDRGVVWDTEISRHLKTWGGRGEIMT